MSSLRFALLVSLALAGCKSGSSLSLNASTHAATVDDDAGVDAGASADAGGVNLCGQLLVDRLRVVVRRIDLERTAPDAGADAGPALCDCPDGGTVCVTPDDDVHVGPFLVDLAGGEVTGGVHHVFDVDVPEGRYDDVRFVINTISHHQAADGGLHIMQELHASIAANGTFGGAPFQFTTPIRLQQKQQGPFTVGPGTSNIVLAVDPSGWFVGGNGQVLDPNDPRNRGAILANIRCSVRMSSEAGAADGGTVKRDFDDDEDEDRCRAHDEDDDGEHASISPFDHGGDDGDHGHGGGDGHPHACVATPLDCGDAGTP